MNTLKCTDAVIELHGTHGLVHNESVTINISLLDEDSELSYEYSDLEGSLFILSINQNDKRYSGAGRASAALRSLINYCDRNEFHLSLYVSSSGDLTDDELIKWYSRNGFKMKSRTDKLMVRKFKRIHKE